MGAPAASSLTLAPGAGHGDEGDASLQGPAQEKELPASPKPTQADAAIFAGEPSGESSGEPSVVIALAARLAKPEATNEIAVARETSGLVTVRAKPAKRLNAKERAKANAKDGITPDMKAKAKSKAEAKAAAKAKRKKARQG